MVKSSEVGQGLLLVESSIVSFKIRLSGKSSFKRPCLFSKFLVLSNGKFETSYVNGSYFSRIHMRADSKEGR